MKKAGSSGPAFQERGIVVSLSCLNKRSAGPCSPGPALSVWFRAYRASTPDNSRSLKMTVMPMVEDGDSDDFVVHDGYTRP